jgi:acyl carrier protein
MSGNGRPNGLGARTAILAFLETIRRPEQPLDGIGDDDHLVQLGLIDSLAMLEIVAFLEHEFGLNFRDGGIDPQRFTSISRILDLIAEHGR